MTGLDFSKIEGFEWDKGNHEKNDKKHGVTRDECEQMFLNQPLRFFDDEVHSKNEERYGVLGKTNEGRRLVALFTIRKNKIRVISTRDQGKKDRKIYEEIEKQFEKAG
jgi:uncharacterized DUF497 family protein